MSEEGKRNYETVRAQVDHLLQDTFPLRFIKRNTPTGVIKILQYRHFDTEWRDVPLVELKEEEPT